MGTLNEDLTAIKAVEDTLTPNKVATFAYTEQVYQNNDANGVTIYDVDKPQNIPVATPAVLAVNETVLAKGWRSQASSIPRMLLNHFLGRCSYNLNKIVDIVDSLLTTLTAHLGTANGIATLDASGKLPSGQIPASVVRSVNSHAPENGNVNVSKSDVGLGSVINTGDSATPAQGGTEKFTTGGAYTLRSGLASDIGDVKQELSSDIEALETNLGADIETLATNLESVEQDLDFEHTTVSDHIHDENNPHHVHKAQIGLGNVLNTGDSDTPQSGGTEKFTTGGAQLLLDHILDRHTPFGISYNQYFWSDNDGSRTIHLAETTCFGVVCLRLKNESTQDSDVTFYLRDGGSYESASLFVPAYGWITHKLIRIGTEETLFGFVVPANFIHLTDNVYQCMASEFLALEEYTTPQTSYEHDSEVEHGNGNS